MKQPTVRGRRVPFLALAFGVLVVLLLLVVAVESAGLTWFDGPLAAAFVLDVMLITTLLFVRAVNGLQEALRWNQARKRGLQQPPWHGSVEPARNRPAGTAPAGSGAAAAPATSPKAAPHPFSGGPARPTPYAFNAPPGWATPADDWIPPSGWEPDRSWPAMPERWELWRGTTPRPSPQQSVWEARDHSRSNFMETFDAEKAREQLATDDGRASIARQARGVQSSVRRWQGDRKQDRLDGKVQLSPWHPYAWALWRSEEAVARTLGELEARLIHVPAEVDEVDEQALALWRQAHVWLDEQDAARSDLMDAERELRFPTKAVIFNGVPWQQAEEVAAAALRQMGHDDARVTGSGTDRGLDVLGRSIAAQVKYTGAAVGRPIIQQLVGAAGSRATAFFSRTGYTAQAVEEADRHGMALFTLILPSSVTAVNGAARQLAGR